MRALHEEGGRTSAVAPFTGPLPSLIAKRWPWLLMLPLLAGTIALGVTYLMPKVFTSRTVLLPPQPHAGSSSSALAALGGLSALAGAATGIKSPADQHVALLHSTTVADRVIDKFDLVKVYGTEYRFQAREALARNSRISLGRKDGLITVEVDDTEPRRAADIANQYVDELRRLTSELSITEAQQRRAFFEAQLSSARDRLTKAQQALGASGFTMGALRTDARAAAESYARLRAEITGAEVRLQTLRQTLSDDTPEVQRAASSLSALRSQLQRLEEQQNPSEERGNTDYVGKFREFKYQETLFDMFARQYELARIDESREGALIQVVDVAKPAEWKSRPKRALIAVTTAMLTLASMLAFFALRHFWATSQAPRSADSGE